ncbi:MAG TPA: hypothetical protein VNQ34_11640 [Xanthobacteraceae bacterium]|nr:hypothetical protein [Xanthobacteraceae bacterium]
MDMISQSNERDRVVKLYAALVKKSGREDAREALIAFLGSRSPNQLRDEDLPRAEKVLTMLLDVAEKAPANTSAKMPEGKAPGLAKVIWGQFNAPKKRNAISGEIVEAEPESEPDQAEVDAEKATVEASIPHDAKRMEGLDTAEILRRWNHPPKRK